MANKTIEASKVQDAIKQAWDEADRRGHGNPFISLESVLLLLGMADAAYTDDTSHRKLDFSCSRPITPGQQVGDDD